MTARKLRAKADAALLKAFINPQQLRCTVKLCEGDEGKVFQDILTGLHDRITAMPGVRGQDGKGEEAIVYLHYFKGGADWYITEKDEGRQIQAFGLADLFQDGGELGYISIEELLANGVELDYHWEPRTLAEARNYRD